MTLDLSPAISRIGVSVTGMHSARFTASSLRPSSHTTHTTLRDAGFTLRTVAPGANGHVNIFVACLPHSSSVPNSASHTDGNSNGNEAVSCLKSRSAVIDEQDFRAESGSSASTSYNTLGGKSWPRKSSLYVLRTDGKSCSRELVTGKGRLTFAYPSTQQHLLVWRHRPKSVMVLKKLGDELMSEFLEVVSCLALEHQLHVVVEPSVYAETVAHNPALGTHTFTWREQDLPRLAEHVDFIVCLGGDGVILHAGSLFQSNIPPVIAFNLGSLGFLTNHAHSSFRQDLENVIYGASSLATCSLTEDDLGENSMGVMVTLRMRLKCEIIRSGCDHPEQVYDVLNEMVIDRGPNAFLTNIECYEKGRFITRVQADGIMLSTPTGSTAYSVAAGGSMVHPNVPAILLTPICPHSLSFRPIMLPDYAELELRIPDNARCTAWACFDGRSRQELGRGDSIRVRMSDAPMPTINKADLTIDWFDSLERCFRWSDRKQQLPLAGSGKKPAAELAELGVNGAEAALWKPSELPPPPPPPPPPHAQPQRPSHVGNNLT